MSNNSFGNLCATRHTTQWVALSSNVSKLGSKEVIRHAELVSASQSKEVSKEVSKKLRNFSFAIKKVCHCENERSEDVAIAKSLNINEITTQSSIARNDKSSSETNLTSFLDMFFSRFTSHFSRKRVAFTLAEGATHVDTCDGKRKIAYTLAEVLITLGIIGVVASLTLPSVVANYKKQVTVNQLKKAYSTLGQVAQKAVADNGPVGLGVGSTVTVDEVKEFFNTYWLPYFKGVSVFPEDKKVILNDDLWHYKTYAGNIYNVAIATIYSSGRIFFSTADGMTYFIDIMDWKNVIYDDNGNISSADKVFSSKQTAFVDVNGIKPPNTFGKDVFYFVIDFDKGVVRPYDYSGLENTVNSRCMNTGFSCATKIMRESWKINY